MDARVFTTVKGKRLVDDAATAATAAAVRSPPVGMRPFHRAFYTFLMELKWVMSCEQITERHSRFFFFHFILFLVLLILCLCPLVFHIEKDKLASKMLSHLFVCFSFFLHKFNSAFDRVEQTKQAVNGPDREVTALG